MTKPYDERTGYLDGLVTISKPNGDGIDYVEIELKDANNRIELLTIRISYEQFTHLILGLAGRDCTYEIRGKSFIGMKRENKTITVDISGLPYMTTDEQYLERLNPHEIDGWQGSLSDIKNHKNHIHDKNGKSQLAKVKFVRYVEQS